MNYANVTDSQQNAKELRRQLQVSIPRDFSTGWRLFSIRPHDRKAKPREVVPAQPVDATLHNQLIRRCFPVRIDSYWSTQSEPKRSFVSFESTLADEINLVETDKKASSECCGDPLRPPALPETDDKDIAQYDLSLAAALAAGRFDLAARLCQGEDCSQIVWVKQLVLK